MGLDIRDLGSNNRVEVAPDAIQDELRVEIKGNDNLVRIGRSAAVPAGIEIEGNRNEVAFGDLAHLLGETPIRIQGEGNELWVGAGCHCLARVWLRTNGAALELGEGTTSQEAIFALDEPKRISLGRDCMLAGGVWIAVSDTHSVIDLDTGARINTPKDIIIGDHVWLGMHTAILKGAEIGAGSIIGAGSVVTGKIPPNTMAAGAPARVRRRNVTWKRTLIDVAARATGEVDLAPKSRDTSSR